MKSLGTQLQELDERKDDLPLSEWEYNFITSMMAKSSQGKDTTKLSENMVATIERLHDEHCD